MYKGKKATLAKIMELAAKNNLEVMDIKLNGHYKVEVKRPDGVTGNLIVSGSPSCHRAAKNLDRQWRHFAIGLYDRPPKD